MILIFSSASSRRTTGCSIIYAIGFFILTAIVLWFAFEIAPVPGSAARRHIAKRQAEIAAAEKAVGETAL